MKNRTIPGHSMRPHIDAPVNSHIHRGLNPFFRSRDAARDSRLKMLFRINLIEHRLQRRPGLLYGMFTEGASGITAPIDCTDIRVRHGRRLSLALDVFTVFALLLLSGLAGSAGAAIAGNRPADAIAPGNHPAFAVMAGIRQTDPFAAEMRGPVPEHPVKAVFANKDINSGLLSPITLQGTVWSAPTNNFPVTDVAVYDTNGMIFLGNTSTAQGTGQYQLTVLPVGLDEKTNRNSEMVVLGNPVMNEANLELTVLNQDNYKISVFDVTGKQLYNQEVSLAEGDNKITITGLGAPGIKLVQVTDGQKTHTAKVLQLAASDFDPSISTTPTSGHKGVLKTSNYTTTLRMNFTPPAGYVPNFKLVPAQSATVNDTVMQESQTINKTLNIFDVNGLAVAPGQSNIATYYTLKVKFKDGTIINFPANNGIITINRTEYETFSDSLTLIPDTIANPKFLEWMIGRKIHQQRYEANIFQNEKENIPGQYIHPGNVNIAIANMPDNMQMYLVPKKCLDPRNMTDSITLDQTKMSGSSHILTFEMMCRAPPGYMTKFVDVTTARPLYFVIDTWDIATNNPIPTADQDRVQTELEKQVNVIPFLANGDSLLPGFVITRESSYNSTIWQQIIARGNNQFHETRFKSGSQPGNNISLTTNGSYNGTLIMKASTSTYPPSAPTGTIGAELWEGIWCMTDPYTGGTSTFIYNTGTLNISDYCKAITRWKLLLDPGTPVN